MRLVLAGAGHAHVVVLRRLAARRPDGASITLVTPGPRTAYSGMIPGVIAGLHREEAAWIDVASLARAAGARLIEDAVTGIDLPGRRVLREAGPAVPFDILSLDIGARADLAVPGAAAHAIPAKPIGALLGRIAALRRRIPEGGAFSLVVVGGGAGGTELILALASGLRPSVAKVSLTLVAGAEGLLPGFPAAFRRRAARALARHGVALLDGAAVARVDQDGLALADGRTIRADAVLWATQAAAPPWLRDTGLALDARGFLAVDAWLRVGGRGDVFAAGDVAAFQPRALPKSGVYAVRQGAVLAANLRRALAGRPPMRYRPQRAALVLLSTGDRRAIGTRNGLVAEGAWVWRLKDALDRRFVSGHAPRLEPAPGGGDR